MPVACYTAYDMLQSKGVEIEGALMDAEDVRKLIHAALKEELDSRHYLTAEDARLIARQSVSETLQAIGIDTDRKTSTQEDMAFLREMRRCITDWRKMGWRILIGIGITGMVGLLFTGAMEEIKSLVHYEKN